MIVVHRHILAVALHLFDFVVASMHPDREAAERAIEHFLPRITRTLTNSRSHCNRVIVIVWHNLDSAANGFLGVVHLADIAAPCSTRLFAALVVEYGIVVVYSVARRLPLHHPLIFVDAGDRHVHMHSLIGGHRAMMLMRMIVHVVVGVLVLMLMRVAVDLVRVPVAVHAGEWRLRCV